jgi:hypothetical protein
MCAGSVHDVGEITVSNTLPSAASASMFGEVLRA